MLSEDERAGGGLPKILVVVANPDVQQAVAACLKGDFWVAATARADDGLAELEAWQPELMICDFPLAAGAEPLLRQVRQCPEFDPIPILILVEAMTEAVHECLLEDLAQDYVVKPLHPGEVLIRCKKLLAVKRTTQLLANQARERAVLLAQSENRFRLMVESIEEYAMFMVNLTGEIISWNRGAERLTGYSEAEAIGRHFSMLYPREELDETHATHELAMASRYGRYEEEGTRVRKNGSTYRAQITVWRLDDTRGQPIGFAKITRDVTTRHQAQEREAALLESENRFRLMVESVQDYAMFMVDLEGVITSWNPGAERMTGYTEAEALGRHFSILYPREQLDTDHAVYELASARQHGRHEEEGVRVRKDGSAYYAQILIWPMRDRSGEVVGFAKINRDITARRLAEEALRESEARFRTITDAMPQMVWSTRPDGYHDYFNEQWYRFTGAAAGSTDGEAWNQLLHPDDQARARQVWQHSLVTGQIYEIQYRLRHVSGKYRWTLGRALPVRSERGQILRWMGTLTDIHEQKQAEEALQDAARHKDEFLAMLAHELRNPLAPVRNSTILLRRLIHDDEAVGALNVIERQVRHMTCLIDDLLDMARISRGKIEIRKEPIDLIEVVRHTVEDFAADYEAKGVHLLLDITYWSLWLEGDRTRIAQVVGNLLHNALKFTDAGGEVAVIVTREEGDGAGTAVIAVADSGVGIERQLTSDLFNPFIQANQGLARSKGGLGLGLALVKGLVELHGGTVAADSEGLGRGSRFTLRLPLVAPREDYAVLETEIEGPRRPLRILLIDDNPDMLETLGTLLSIEGHQVAKAADGETGLAAIGKVQPDLVLCDIGLPGAKDGYAVARAVRASPAIAGTFLVALSGYGQEQDRRRARESGFDKHLLKPLEFAELAEVLAAAAEGKRPRAFDSAGSKASDNPAPSAPEIRRADRS